MLDEEEFIEKMKCNCFTGDSEGDHINADDILCDFLLLLGYEKLVEVYKNVEKWYAQKGE